MKYYFMAVYYNHNDVSWSKNIPPEQFRRAYSFTGAGGENKSLQKRYIFPIQKQQASQQAALVRDNDRQRRCTTTSVFFIIHEIH
ncbi:MAG: hypothetical protein UC944_05875 [Anaerovibrio sp.]|nr:hypothetical protein [Anaerovibrio sp.]